MPFSKFTTYQQRLGTIDERNKDTVVVEVFIAQTNTVPHVTASHA